jgi:hypothetical protein
MIELVYILRAIVEEVACDGEDLRQQKKCGRPMPPIKFSELEKFVFDKLRWEGRTAIYATAWEMRRELERLADLDVIKFESDEVKIEDPNEFLKKTEPFILVARNMIGGNEHLKYVIRRIEESAKRYATDNIKSLALQPV